MAVSNYYDEIAEVYDAGFQSKVCRIEDEVIYGYISVMLNASGGVLDVGCGTGAALGYLPMLDKNCYEGLDISPGMIRVARKRHPGFRFTIGDAVDVNRLYPDVQFDSMFSCFGSLSYAREIAFQPLANALLSGWGSAVFVLYTARRRKHYTGAGRIPARFDTAYSATQTLRMAGFRHVHITGLNFSLWQMRCLPAKTLKRLAQWEFDNMTGNRANNCHYIVATCRV